MKLFLDRLARGALVTSGLCLVAMTAIITYQVVARYVFNASPAWSERLSLVLLAYLVFLGAAAGVRLGFHIRISAISDTVPPRWGKVFSVATHLAVAGAGLVILVAGIELTTTLWAFAIPSLGIPRGLALLPIPISGALITIFSLASLAGAEPLPHEEAD